MPIFGRDGKAMGASEALPLTGRRPAADGRFTMEGMT